MGTEDDRTTDAGNFTTHTENAPFLCRRRLGSLVRAERFQFGHSSAFHKTHAPEAVDLVKHDLNLGRLAEAPCSPGTDSDEETCFNPINLLSC